jgi:hypothetical protein
MGLLGNSKWGPGGANDNNNNDDAESSMPPQAPRSQESNKEDRAPRWKKGKAACNKRSAVDEQPGILGRGIDHGYGTASITRGDSNFPRPENPNRQASSTQFKSLADRISRDVLLQDTPRSGPDPQGIYNASWNGRTTVPPMDLTQHQDSSAQPPQRMSPYERMARDALLPNTNTHHGNTVASASRNTPSASTSRQAMIPPPPQHKSDFHTATVEDEQTTPTQSTFPKNAECKFAFAPASPQAPKPVVKRPAVKVVGPVSNPPAACVTTISPVPPVDIATLILTHVDNVHGDMTTFRIPPQSTLSDTDFFFLLGRLRGRTVSVEEWEGAAAKIRDVKFEAFLPSSSSSSSSSSSLTMAKTGEGVVETEDKGVVDEGREKGEREEVGDVGKGKAKAGSRLSDEFRRLMALEEVEGEEDEL